MEARSGAAGSAGRTASPLDHRGLLQQVGDDDRGVGDLENEGPPVVVAELVKLVSERLYPVPEDWIGNQWSAFGALSLPRRKSLDEFDLVENHENPRIGLADTPFFEGW